jgi:soluble lytic murein transglycosylase-like protein
MKRFALLSIITIFGFISGSAPTLATDKLVVAKSMSIKDMIAQQETQKGIPQDLLRAIAKIESGISPWAVNVAGRGHIFKSKEAAAKYVRELLEEGTTNFSVGCMQLHYASHRRHFKSVEAMLEPQNNIAHAAKLIKNLEQRHGSMERAVKLYHSPSPVHHNRYKNRVYGMWAKIRRPDHSQNEALKAVALKKEFLKSQPLKAIKKSPKIKFGVGGTSAKEDRQKS